MSLSAIQRPGKKSGQYITFLALSLLLFSACKMKTPNSVIDKTASRLIDSTLQAFVNDGRAAGVSALIYEGGKEVYFNAIGYANLEDKVEMDRNTLVRIYSMTKPITGTALMQLWQQQKFQLDDPVAKYFPEFSGQQVYSGLNEAGYMKLLPLQHPMLIRDLTRHTSGLPTNSDLPPGMDTLAAKTNAMSWKNNLQQMAVKFASMPLLFQPNTQWAYGPSVDMQAALVERLSGQSFDQYLRDSIFRPLGMKNTGYFVPEDQRSHLANLYFHPKDSALIARPDSFNIEHWPLTPGGFGLTATIDDYMRFARMLLNRGSLDGKTILDSSTVRLMSTNQLSDTISQRMWLPSKGQVGFGIDFAVRTKAALNENENFGVPGEFFWDGAASTLFWIDPENDLAAVFFVQVLPFDGSLHKDFRDAVYSSLIKRETEKKK